ncbi:hypothetical protein LIA77_10418 [Sarocladium implicatum]|nr:hypothetical protein LIA77_10418 [Sarocladium implicatum]
MDGQLKSKRSCDDSRVAYQKKRYSLMMSRRFVQTSGRPPQPQLASAMQRPPRFSLEMWLALISTMTTGIQCQWAKSRDTIETRFDPRQQWKTIARRIQRERPYGRDPQSPSHDVTRIPLGNRKRQMRIQLRRGLIPNLGVVVCPSKAQLTKLCGKSFEFVCRHPCRLSSHLCRGGAVLLGSDLLARTFEPLTVPSGDQWIRLSAHTRPESRCQLKCGGYPKPPKALTRAPKTWVGRHVSVICQWSMFLFSGRLCRAQTSCSRLSGWY